jgi:ankyrin repeat protein
MTAGPAVACRGPCCTWSPIGPGTTRTARRRLLRWSRRVRTSTPGSPARTLWGACHGGQLSAAQFLLDHGAELNWVPGWENLTPLDAATRSGATDVIGWLRGRGAKTATELGR